MEQGKPSNWLGGEPSAGGENEAGLGRNEVGHFVSCGESLVVEVEEKVLPRTLLGEKSPEEKPTNKGCLPVGREAHGGGREAQR